MRHTAPRACAEFAAVRGQSGPMQSTAAPGDRQALAETEWRCRMQVVCVIMWETSAGPSPPRVHLPRLLLRLGCRVHCVCGGAAHSTRSNTGSSSVQNHVARIPGLPAPAPIRLDPNPRAAAMRLAPALALILLALGHVAGAKAGRGRNQGTGPGRALAAQRQPLLQPLPHRPPCAPGRSTRPPRAPHRCYTLWGHSFRRALGAGWPRSAASHASGDA